MKLTNKFMKWGIMAVLGAVLVLGCKEDEPELDVIASFQFEMDEDDFLTVQFRNFSQNATQFAWDFGDQNTSAEENPAHTYASTGTYRVKLTVTSASGVTNMREEEIEVSDPNAKLTLLTGLESKTWKLMRDAVKPCMGVGPNEANWNEWWPGLVNNGVRNCVYDDEVTFHRDGRYVFNDNNSFWGEFGVWPSNDPNYEQCFEPTAENMRINGDDVSAWGSGTHEYTYNVSTDRVTLTGLGAWIGIMKLGTDGEYNRPQQSVTFRATVREGGSTGVDTLYADFAYDGVFWRTIYVSYANPALEPALAGPQPRPSFTYEVDNETRTVIFTNTSTASDSYSWDFGDGSSSTAESPTHQYDEEGVYTVVLTATNGNGTATFSNEIPVGNTNPTAADLHGEDQKTWKLKPVAGAFRVGPSIGSGEWYASGDAEVEGRPCLFDDEFTFTVDFSYIYNANGQVFGEPHMGVDPAGCTDEGDLVAPYDGLASSDDYTFEFVEAADGQRAKITVKGVGAFIGFNKGYNGGEYNGSDTELQSEVTYEVISYVKDGDTETLNIAVDISGEGTAWWSMTLVHE
jgi:PKD repeat protein